MILFLLHTEQYLLLAATLEYTRIHLSNEFPVRLTNNSSYYTDNEGGNTLLHSSDYHKLFEEVTLKSIELFPFLIVNYLLCVVRHQKSLTLGLELSWQRTQITADHQYMMMREASRDACVCRKCVKSNAPSSLASSQANEILDVQD